MCLLFLLRIEGTVAESASIVGEGNISGYVNSEVKGHERWSNGNIVRSEFQWKSVGD